MDNFVGYWGLYPWFDEDGAEMIHEDSYEALKELNPYGKVFYCDSIDGNYIVLKYGDKNYKVSKELFKMVKKPKFNIGEEVIIVKKDIVAVVTQINWHHAKSEEFYHLSVDGKRKSNRYFSCDLRNHNE